MNGGFKIMTNGAEETAFKQQFYLFFLIFYCG